MAWIGRWLNRWKKRIRTLIRRAAVERELDEELAFHLEMETEKNIREGMSPEEARRQAAIKFGGVDRYKEKVREARTLGWVPGLSLDWKLGVRMLLKHPGLSIVGILAMAGAIGIGVVWFELVHEQLYPNIPLEGGDRLVRLEVLNTASSTRERLTLHDLKAWRGRLTSVEELGAFRLVERNLFSPSGEAEPTLVAEITASAFHTARVPPEMGRALLPDDERPGATPVVVLGHDIWQTRFDGREGIIGESVQLGGARRTVVGVMPAGYAFPRHEQAWIPLTLAEGLPEESPTVEVFGRLAPGASFTSSQAEVTALQLRPASSSSDAAGHLRPRVRAFAGRTPGDPLSLQILVMYAGILLVLAVVSANVATLVFARTAMRESEIVVRNALGAGRGRILRQLFVEALVLAVVAAVAGFGLARLAIGWYWHEAVVVWQVPQAFWTNFAIGPATVVFTTSLALLGAGIVGILPGLKATSSRLRPAIQRINGGGTSMRFGGIWSVIIVMQVAITVFCLPIGAGISLEMIRDYRERSAFSTERFLTFRAELDEDGIPSAGPGSGSYAGRREAVLNDLRERLEREPELRQVTFADGLPGSSPRLRRVEVQRGRETPTPIRGNLDGWVAVSSVGEDFFATFAVPLMAGRGFGPLDREADPKVVIINESFADKLGGNPLGVRVRTVAQGDGEPGPWKEVVGVVQNLGMEPTDRGEADYLFSPATPLDVFPPVFALDVPGGPGAFRPRLAAIAREIDPGLRLHDVTPLDELVRRRALPMVMISVGATGVVFVALLLAAAGLFAITAVAVARRTREVGIRLALGASRRSVLRALFGRAAAQVAAGIAIGSFLLLGAGFLTADDPSIRDTFAWALGPLLAISGTMIFVAITASAIPAQRALRIQPSDALREDVAGSS